MPDEILENILQLTPTIRSAFLSSVYLKSTEKGEYIPELKLSYAPNSVKPEGGGVGQPTGISLSRISLG